MSTEKPSDLTLKDLVEQGGEEVVTQVPEFKYALTLETSLLFYDFYRKILRIEHLAEPPWPWGPGGDGD
jgi:hypothetical protein